MALKHILSLGRTVITRGHLGRFSTGCQTRIVYLDQGRVKLSRIQIRNRFRTNPRHSLRCSKNETKNQLWCLSLPSPWRTRKWRLLARMRSVDTQTWLSQWYLLDVGLSRTRIRRLQSTARMQGLTLSGLVPVRSGASSVSWHQDRWADQIKISRFNSARIRSTRSLSKTPAIQTPKSLPSKRLSK